MNKYTWRTATREGVLILAAIVFVAPIYVLLNLSFSPSSGARSPLALATHPTIANYVDAWHQADLGGALLTSILITGVDVALIITVAGLAALPLARATRRWSTFVFGLVMAGLIIPFFIALIPLYRTMHDLHLLGSPVSLIIFNAGIQFPLSVFLYTTFLRQLPRDYEEAALIDGCGYGRMFVSVLLPLLRPVTGTVAILNSIAIWNDFLPPLLFLGNGNYKTLPIAIYGFVGQYTDQWPLIFAGVTISIAPILIVYFAMQRRIMKGLESGLRG